MTLITRTAGRSSATFGREFLEASAPGRSCELYVRSWKLAYLAQPDALIAAGALALHIPKKVLNANADAIGDPKRLFLSLAHDKGQIEHARRIGPELDISSTQSASFKHFVSGLRKLAEMR